ncbi:MAG: hypothetical protein KDA20_12745 [Phycisphaerales bacterium]|nr:hypothetical protein [Phycisphaerales bacterium]
MESFLPQTKEQTKTGDELVKVRAVPYAAGGETFVAVVFDIEPGWHIYWQNPGDSGAAPSLEFTPTDDKGAVRYGDMPFQTTGSTRWPMPERHESAGGILDFVYGHSVVAFVPAGGVTQSQGRVTVGADWLVCRDVCLPGSGQARIQATPSEADLALIQASFERLPTSAFMANVDLRASFSEGKLNIHVPGAKQLIFFPDPSEDMVGPTDAFHEGIADADKLSLQYSHESQNAKVISGVLEVHRADGAEAFVQVSVPGPAASGAAEEHKGTE